MQEIKNWNKNNNKRQTFNLWLKELIKENYVIQQVIITDYENDKLLGTINIQYAIAITNKIILTL